MPRDAYPDDDGRTIADMSDVAGRRDPGALVGDLLGRERSARDASDLRSRDVREELGDSEERRMVILGTLKAGLSLGAVYIIVFCIVIAIMVALWT